jgi:DNA-binding GntR family transcriptional regulator
MKSVATRVIDLIRGDIVSGHLGAGSHLKIDYLAARYQSSHMPIREALRHLEGEGLIVKEPNRGARVRPVNPELVNTIFEVRTSIESMLARHAATRATPHAISKLEAVQGELERFTAAADTEGIVIWNRRFHNVIEDIADLPEAAELANRQCELLDSLWRVYGIDMARTQGVNSDHRYIIQALRDRNPETASILVTAHVIKGRMDLIRRMRPW